MTRILVADDELLLRRLVVRILTAGGHEVIQAANGREAFSIVEADRERAIGLVVSDILMPEMNGLEFAQALGATRPDLPLLFITGCTDDMAAGQGIARLGHPVLKKPFTPAELSEAVRRELDRQS